MGQAAGVACTKMRSFTPCTLKVVQNFPQSIPHCTTSSSLLPNFFQTHELKLTPAMITPTQILSRSCPKFILALFSECWKNTTLWKESGQAAFSLLYQGMSRNLGHVKDVKVQWKSLTVIKLETLAHNTELCSNAALVWNQHRSMPEMKNKQSENLFMLQKIHSGKIS